MSNINSLDERGIYQDLLNKFKSEGHNVFVVSPIERRENKSTYIVEEGSSKILKVKTFNLQKTNLIEKGIGILAIEYQYLRAIRKELSDVKFDLVLYSTPPITFSKIIAFIKKRDNAYAYLLLKDIFPQNAVDMGMIKQGSILHKFFEKKEQKLYDISDTIGCMSEANKEFVLQNNPNISPQKVEVNPNTISPIDITMSEEEKCEIKKKYSIPLDKKIFVYGGNIGKPQGIDFLLQTIDEVSNKNIFFLIVGAGTDFDRIKQWFTDRKPDNAVLLNGLSKNDYDKLLSTCDVGLIFLHKDFTIPNFPSRLLSYLEMKMPVIAATDINTDIGKVIRDNNCGYWVESGDIAKMKVVVSKIISDDTAFEEMRINAYQLLKSNYTVDVSYDLIQTKL